MPTGTNHLMDRSLSSSGMARYRPKQESCRGTTVPNSVVQGCLILGYKYGQKLRQTTGFVQSLLSLMGKSDYAIPDYTTLSRRQSCLPVELTDRWERGEKINIAIDSTGLKVYGEGEWKVRKHGVSKRRT